MIDSRRSRLGLACYDRDCLDKSWEWLNDPEIKALTMTPDFTREDQIAFFSSLPDRVGYHIWGVSFGGRIVGAAGLKNVRGMQAEYWGYIGERELWGKGLGKQLMRLIEGEASCLGYTSLDLRVSDVNSRAISLYRKMGYMDDPAHSEDGVVRMVKVLS